MSITVCIPTIPSRRSTLSRALWHLRGQDCDVLVADGMAPMGDKLNEMFAKATTTHVVCLDDDDYLGPERIIDQGFVMADFVGYRILWLENGRFAGSVAHRGDGDTTWRTFDRGVSPKCLVRTEIARAHEFGNHYTADREWSEAVQADIETHTFIDQHLYVYDHWDAHMVGTTPDAGRIDAPQRDVGVWPFDEGAVTWLV
jgi:hypothetical protein